MSTTTTTNTSSLIFADHGLTLGEPYSESGSGSSVSSDGVFLKHASEHNTGGLLGVVERLEGRHEERTEEL